MRLALQNRGALDKLSPKLTQELDQIVASLNAAFGQENGEDAYGILFGDPAGTHILIDDVNGIQILSGTTSMFSADAAGNLAIAGIITATGGAINGVLSLGLAGGIYQGTGTFAAPTTGLKLWNSSGMGRIAGYNAGVLQWGVGEDGKFTTGGNGVVLTSDGIRLVPSLAPDTPDTNLAWIKTNALDTGEISMGAWDASGSPFIKGLRIACRALGDASHSGSGEIRLEAEGTQVAPFAYYNAFLKIKAENAGGYLLFGDTAYHLRIEAVNGAITWDGDTTLYRGAANLLRTDDSLRIGLATGEKLEIVSAGSATLAENIRFSRGDTARFNSLFSYSDDSGNAYLKFCVHDGVTAYSQIDALKLMGNGKIIPAIAGIIEWGGDTTLRRVSAGILRIGDGTDTTVVTYPGLEVNIAGVAKLVVRDSTDDVEMGMFAHPGGTGYFGTFTNHPLVFRVNNADVVTVAVGGAITCVSLHPTTAIEDAHLTTNVQLKNADWIPVDNTRSLGDATHRFANLFIYVPNSATAGTVFLTAESNGEVRKRAVGLSRNVNFTYSGVGYVMTFTDGLLTNCTEP